MEPNSQILEDIERHAVIVANSAGELIEKYFHSTFDINYKSEGSSDPVTTADIEADLLIRNLIKEKFPDHSIISEENEAHIVSNADYCWVIDPLDGTNNFLNKFPFHSISIGILFKGQPIVGVILLRNLPWQPSSIIRARKGNGTFLDDQKVNVVSNNEPLQTGLANIRFARSRYKAKRELAKNTGDFRSIGSTAYEISLIATSSLQLAVFNHPKIWDIAAGIIIVKEAGGEIMMEVKPNKWITSPIVFLNSEFDTYPTLYNWNLSILAGPSNLIDYVSKNIKRRSFLDMFIRRTRWKLGLT